jgi:undecaprenyl-diphosphatase
VPVGVALARMYRGMHHPSDVVAAFINGVTCVVVMSRALLDRSFPRRAERRINGARPRLATQ